MLPDHPSEWPQRPLIIQPTPNSSTKIIGIRLARQDDYKQIMLMTTANVPINNGTEEEGEALVVDFESIHFIGTLLVRIKQAPLLVRGKNEERGDSHASRDGGTSKRDYFANKKRKFQVVIKGRFRTSLSMSRCVTGQIFDRRAGKLPARWLVKSAINFFSILAPQLDASLDDDKPRFLSPLVATAQTVLSGNDVFEKSPNNTESWNLESARPLKNSDHHLDIDTVTNSGEPPSVKTSSVFSDLSADSILGISVPDTTLCSVARRMSARKNIFNALSVKRSLEPRFHTNKTYTFEFFQHLLDFGDELAVDMGRIGGMVPLAPALNCQPLKIFAAHKNSEKTLDLEALWSFDIFHESLYSSA